MGILDPRFKYVPASTHADSADYLRAKFRRMQREIDARRKANQEEAARVVKPMRREKT